MTDLTCASGVDLLMDYVEGALDAQQRNAVDHHVAHCARCQAFVASYQMVPSILRRATEAELPAGVARTLARALAATSEDPPQGH